MIRLLLPSFHGLLLIASVLLLLPCATFGAELGYVMVSKNSNGFGSKVHKIRKLERVGGFYVAQSFTGGTERYDAFHVGFTVELSSFQPANLNSSEQIAQAKALELRARTAIKEHPQLATHLNPYLIPLRAEIERTERGDKKIDGKWLTAQQMAAAHELERGTIKRGALQLTDGTTYRDVEIVSADTQELRIIHSDGAAKIPLRLVPADFKKKYLIPAAAVPGK